MSSYRGGRHPIPAELRFMQHVEVTDGCWNWLSNKNSGGYGLFFTKKAVSAHRFSYECEFGKIGEGLTLDHKCRNRACVNPYHLEPMSTKKNILLGVGPTAINARKTHCNYGHELYGSNLYVRNGSRICRKCNLARGRKCWRLKNWGHQ